MVTKENKTMLKFDTNNNPYLEEIEVEVVSILNDIDATLSVVADFDKIVKLSESLFDKIYSTYDRDSLRDVLMSLGSLPDNLKNVSRYTFMTKKVENDLNRLQEICDEMSYAASEVSSKPFSDRTTDDDMLVDAYLYFYDEVYEKVRKAVNKAFPGFRF